MGLSISITLNNNTTSPTTYVDGHISLPGSGAVTVSSGLIPFLAFDPSFISDALANNVTVSDGASEYSLQSAIDFLKSNWVDGNAPQNSNDPVTFALAGFGFSLAASASFGNNTETPVLLLTNPSASTVSARALFFYSATVGSQGTLISRIYTDPVVSASGSDISSDIVNSLVGSSITTSLVATTGPSVSSFGQMRVPFISAAGTTPPLHSIQQTAILQPNHSLLLTGQASNLALAGSITGYFFFHWVEI